MGLIRVEVTCHGYRDYGASVFGLNVNPKHPNTVDKQKTFKTKRMLGDEVFVIAFTFCYFYSHDLPTDETCIQIAKRYISGKQKIGVIHREGIDYFKLSELAQSSYEG